jgi:hypothetical protein
VRHLADMNERGPLEPGHITGYEGRVVVLFACDFPSAFV